jgi:hypothetical protein
MGEIVEICNDHYTTPGANPTIAEFTTATTLSM